MFTKSILARKEEQKEKVHCFKAMHPHQVTKREY